VESWCISSKQEMMMRIFLFKQSRQQSACNSPLFFWRCNIIIIYFDIAVTFSIITQNVLMLVLQQLHDSWEEGDKESIGSNADHGMRIQ
jgi:hypothetical protein